ncbi:hypothetical protein, partial [Burkholderia ubonensis]|uniref:hypothetical protein n=1 Tax=Burkholderia ubonensis TaxID=101571 RepID=UPI001E3635B7
ASGVHLNKTVLFLNVHMALHSFLAQHKTYLPLRTRCCHHRHLNNELQLITPTTRAARAALVV